MDKNQICIVIPIYKKELNSFEIQSVKQCVKILSDYVICFVYPKGLNIKFYTTNFPKIKEYVCFDKKYFNSLAGYNKLMLNNNFYKAFKNYKYMLLYQTDCYVFRDELLAWVEKGYDYIGGVWFENFRGNPTNGAKVWFPGNGGLSLRKIKSIFNLLTSKTSLGFKKLNEDKAILKIEKKFNFFKWNLVLPFRLLGYKNNFNYLSKIYKANEDVFFMDACVKYKKLTSPSVEEAILFSWDRHPDYLFKEYKTLPFACHAWYRDEIPYEANKEFWLSKIAI
ncbi:MAG: hypothetical protein ACI93N_000585 [Flavobacteriaceae bacterium]|jgi:hypothetical protein